MYDLSDRELDYLLVSFAEGPDRYLDGGQALLPGLFGLSSWDNGLALARQQIDALLTADLNDYDFEMALVARGVREGLPEGHSWRRWLETVGERLDGWMIELPSREEESAGWNDDRALPRVSSFTDTETANSAATAVVRAHEASLRAWAADHRGHARWVGHTDTGSTVGRVMTAGAERGNTTPVSSVTVVMRWDAASGNPYIQTAYPEIPLDPTVRETYPDLHRVFAGYFGQDWDAADGAIWQAQETFLYDTTDPAWSAVRDQLSALLTVPDADLRHALTHLGSYVLPTNDVRLRGWLERKRWRMDAFDWTRPPA